MSQPNPTPDDENTLLMTATDTLVERTTPWLVDIGSWIFGGLIAFNLILLGPLITIRPVDHSIMVAITALALALPLDVAGLFVLRLARDLEHTEYETDFENEVRQAIEGSGRTTGKPTAPPTARKRKTGISLLYSSGILALCVVLTLAGVVAALWHTAWWIATGFAVMALISCLIVFIAVVASQPPRSPEEIALLRRYGEEYVRQAKEQALQDEERK